MSIAQRLVRKQDAVLQSAVMMEQYVKEAEQILKELIPVITKHTGVHFSEWEHDDKAEARREVRGDVKLQPEVLASYLPPKETKLDQMDAQRTGPTGDAGKVSVFRCAKV
eukprot:4004786-Amphidinium_carterae.1